MMEAATGTGAATQPRRWPMARREPARGQRGVTPTEDAGDGICRNGTPPAQTAAQPRGSERSSHSHHHDGAGRRSSGAAVSTTTCGGGKRGLASSRAQGRPTKRGGADPGMKDNSNTDSLDRAESCLSSTNYDREVFLKTLDKQECLQESNCDGRSNNNRPLSPGSQALICDEGDLVFQLSRDEDAINLTMTHSLPDIFIEQEKHVLTNFRDCLCKLANCGRRHGEDLASMSNKHHEQTPDDSINGSTITRAGEASGSDKWSLHSPASISDLHFPFHRVVLENFQN